MLHPHILLILLQGRGGARQGGAETEGGRERGGGEQGRERASEEGRGRECQVYTHVKLWYSCSCSTV